MTGEPVQLLVYRFPAGAAFEGHLVGALERMEAGGALRILDILVVGSDAATGETFAVDLHGTPAGGFVAPLLGFRLDPSERARTTRRTLAHAGEGAALISGLAGALGPGEVIVALLVGHSWAHGVADAVARTDGAELANAMVAPAVLTELAADILATVGR